MLIAHVKMVTLTSMVVCFTYVKIAHVLFAFEFFPYVKFIFLSHVLKTNDLWNPLVFFFFFWAPHWHEDVGERNTYGESGGLTPTHPLL